MDSRIGMKNYAIVREFWITNVNIKIRENKDLNNDWCVIYASSNGIWNPNTIEEFNYSIVHNNRFEWENFGGNCYRKQIFVRDILKEWYVNGVNGSINSIDKLISFIKKETQGYSLVTVGNSAGGYLASILGITLSAQYVLNFSGQNSIWEYAYRENEYPELFANISSGRGGGAYFDITSMVKNSEIPIFYFYAANCEQDIKQHSLICNCKNVYSFAFNTASHGVSMYPFNLPIIVDMKKEELLLLYHKYNNKIISQKSFAYETMNHAEFWIQYFKYLRRYIPKAVKWILKKYIRDGLAFRLSADGKK